MDVPKAYIGRRMMDNILKPALKELKANECFQNLECTVQYARKRGRPVVGYIFTFTPEERVNQKKLVLKQKQGRKYSLEEMLDLEKQLLANKGLLNLGKW